MPFVGTRPVSSSRYIEIDSNFTLYTSVWIISQMLKALLKNGVVFRRRKIKAQQTECLGSKRLGISGWWGLPKAESVVKIGKVFHPFVQQIPHIDKAHQKLLDVKNRLWPVSKTFLPTTETHDETPKYNQPFGWLFGSDEGPGKH